MPRTPDTRPNFSRDIPGLTERQVKLANDILTLTIKASNLAEQLGMEFRYTSSICCLRTDSKFNEQLFLERKLVFISLLTILDELYGCPFHTLERYESLDKIIRSLAEMLFVVSPVQEIRLSNFGTLHNPLPPEDPTNPNEPLYDKGSYIML